MKTILFRTSLVGMLATSVFYAQSLSSLDTSASSNPGAGQPPAHFSVTDLGTFTTFSIAFGIDNAGRVGGTAALPNGDSHPSFRVSGPRSTISVHWVDQMPRRARLTEGGMRPFFPRLPRQIR